MALRASPRLGIIAVWLAACGGAEDAPPPGAAGAPGSGGVLASGGASGGSAGGGGTPQAGSGGSGGGKAGAPARGGASAGDATAGGASASGGSSGGAAASGAGAGGTPTCGGIPARDPEAFVHPGGLHKRSDLERMRYQVEAGVEPWAESFARLAADAHASPTYVVRGDPTWTSVERGGTHGAEFESDANAAYLNALMWAVTGDERHAEKCVEIFETWKGLTLVVPTGTGPLNAGLFAYKLVEAAELIASTYDGWPEADRAAFGAMLVHPGYSQAGFPPELSDTNGSFYWRIVNGDPGRHGNQDLLAWRAMLVMGVFLDQRVMFDRALRYFKGEISFQAARISASSA